MKALIAYHTKTGHTLKAAEDIASGLKKYGVECTIRPTVNLVSHGELQIDVSGFDIVLVGSPTYGSRLYKSPARPVEAFVESIPGDVLKGKYCGAFTVNAGVGGSMLVRAMELDLAEKGANVVFGGPVVKAGAPLSMWKGPEASPDEVKRCEEFGERVAIAAEKKKR